jgi:mRNA interferase MazF
MRRGEVWWAEFDEPRPVVLLDDGGASGFRAVQVVPPAGLDISDLGVEVPLGAIEGVAYEAVVRLAFPHPDFFFCTWLTSLTAESLIERAAVLPAGKVEEVDEAIRLCSLPRKPSPEATARLNAIRDTLRGGGPANFER